MLKYRQSARKGYSAGKKISGIKRHITVDTQSLPHPLAVTAVNITDISGALQAFEQNKEALKEVESILCDVVYSRKPFAQEVKAISGKRI